MLSRAIKLILLLLALSPASALAHAPASTPTAKLLFARPAYAQPTAASRVVRQLSAREPITGTPTVLPVIASVTRGGVMWLRVRLPGRPNGSVGWIQQNGTVGSSTRWAVAVSLNARRAVIYRDGRTVREFTVVIGKPSTPTPTGSFFVTEKVPQPMPFTLGPWVLALNGYSGVLSHFDGGPGQIALHGDGALNAPLGSAMSNGCVRFADSVAAWLAAHLPVGTPVSIAPGFTFNTQVASARLAFSRFAPDALASKRSPTAAGSTDEAFASPLNLHANFDGLYPQDFTG